GSYRKALKLTTGEALKVSICGKIYDILQDEVIAAGSTGEWTELVTATLRKFKFVKENEGSLDKGDEKSANTESELRQQAGTAPNILLKKLYVDAINAALGETKDTASWLTRIYRRIKSRLRTGSASSELPPPLPGAKSAVSATGIEDAASAAAPVVEAPDDGSVSVAEEPVTGEYEILTNSAERDRLKAAALKLSEKMNAELGSEATIVYVPGSGRWAAELLGVMYNARYGKRLNLISLDDEDGIRGLAGRLALTGARAVLVDDSLVTGKALVPAVERLQGILREGAGKELDVISLVMLANPGDGLGDLEELSEDADIQEEATPLQLRWEKIDALKDRGLLFVGDNSDSVSRYLPVWHGMRLEAKGEKNSAHLAELEGYLGERLMSEFGSLVEEALASEQAGEGLEAAVAQAEAAAPAEISVAKPAAPGIDLSTVNCLHPLLFAAMGTPVAAKVLAVEFGLAGGIAGLALVALTAGYFLHKLYRNFMPKTGASGISATVARLLKRAAKQVREGATVATNMEEDAVERAWAAAKTDVQVAGIIDDLSDQFGMSASQAEETAKAIFMAKKGYLRDGQKMTVDIAGQTLDIEGRRGAMLKDMIARALKERGVEGVELPESVPYEVAFTMKNDGSVEYSDKAGVGIDENGNFTYLNCSQKIYPGTGAKYGHSHPAAAGDQREFDIDRANLDGGSFGDVDSIFVVEGFERLTRLDRTTPALIAASAAATRPWINTFTFTMSADGAVIETITGEDMAEDGLTDLIKTLSAVQPIGYNMIIPNSTIGTLAPPIAEVDTSPPIPASVKDGGIKALEARINALREADEVKGPLVTAVHIDTIANSDGSLIGKTGFEDVARVAAANEAILRTAILIDNDAQAALAEKVKGRVEGGSAIKIVNIGTARTGGTISACVSDAFKRDNVDVPTVKIGVGLLKTDSNVDMIKREFAANGKDSASVVLIGDAVKNGEAETAYINVVNTIHARSEDGASFLALGIDENDAGMSSLANMLRGIIRAVTFIKDVARDLKGWFESVNKLSVSA
ncbi:MAG: hypothetical protein PHT32_06255, partial [Candidatus Omnitrophica bacterium]|nr:hypothetical protein [Candidatus Omnitrophota bacterium]